MLSNIQNSGMFNAHQMRRQMMDNFRSGETNISKDNLKEMESDIIKSGRELPEDFKVLQESFDEIDKNGDGINISELEAYSESTGISFGLGQPPPGMFGEGKPPGGRPPMGVPPPKSNGGEEEESYIDKLLKNYSSYEPDLETYQTRSYSA